MSSLPDPTLSISVRAQIVVDQIYDIALDNDECEEMICRVLGLDDLDDDEDADDAKLLGRVAGRCSCDRGRPPRFVSSAIARRFSIAFERTMELQLYQAISERDALWLRTLAVAS